MIPKFEGTRAKIHLSKNSYSTKRKSKQKGWKPRLRKAERVCERVERNNCKKAAEHETVNKTIRTYRLSFLKIFALHRKPLLWNFNWRQARKWNDADHKRARPRIFQGWLVLWFRRWRFFRRLINIVQSPQIRSFQVTDFQVIYINAADATKWS